jgi:MATE family multidrug resistance protein
MKRTGYTYGGILRISLPLVVTMGATMAMEFTDRIFLARYSLDAIAAALPAGIAAFLLIAFFMGVSGYLNVFIAQYTGAEAHDRVGAALWQGIWFSLMAGVVLAACSLLAEPLFRLSGHPPEVQRLETVYFRILCLGAGIDVLAVGLSCFYSGRGFTRTVMIVHLAGTLINIPLDYALINGVWIFPELGIAGAGIATVTAWTVIAVLFGLLIFTRKNDRRYGVIRQHRFEPVLFLRLLRFGVPSALQFCLDIFAFSFFIFMVGRIGKEAMAATNIVISINSLSFMPTAGFSLGAATLVGQSLGRNRPDEAASAAVRSIHIALLYTALMAVVFVGFPGPVLGLFRPGNTSPDQFAEIVRTGTVLLRFVAVYIFFDAQYMVLTGALKGAGDTRFIMVSVAVVSLLFLILPIVVGVGLFGAGLYFSWGCLTVFVASLFGVSLWRYRQGAWREKRVIEASERG